MEHKFRNLVFEGGGVKGVAYGGAMIELEKKGVLKNLKRAAGTSAGAIIAALAAVGYSAQEINHIMTEINFKDFLDDSFGLIFDSIRLFRKFGWNKGKKFYNWIGKLVESKTGKKDLTFRELHELTGKNKIRDLYVIGTNLSNQNAEIYSYETSPNMEIREAVRISMSIPFYFKAIFKNSNVLVDGGVLYNYPINIFDYKKYLEKKEYGKKVSYNKNKNYIFNSETLGFRLDGKDEILYNKLGWSNAPKKIKNILDFSKVLVSMSLDIVNKRHLHKNDWGRTIFIDTLGVKGTDFNLPGAKIRSLIEEGKKGVKKYFFRLASRKK